NGATAFTTSRIVIFCGNRAVEYPPPGPGCDRTKPPRARSWTTLCRYRRGIFVALASSSADASVPGDCARHTATLNAYSAVFESMIHVSWLLYAILHLDM